MSTLKIGRFALLASRIPLNAPTRSDAASLVANMDIERRKGANLAGRCLLVFFSLEVHKVTALCRLCWSLFAMQTRRSDERQVRRLLCVQPVYTKTRPLFVICNTEFAIRSWEKSQL